MPAGGLPYLDLPGLALASNETHDAFRFYFGEAPGSTPITPRGGSTLKP